MGFLDERDRRDDEHANGLLFEALCNYPVELPGQLREQRPVLQFWSKQPENRDLAENSPASRAVYLGSTKFEYDLAYLLTGDREEHSGLEQFAIRSLRTDHDRYLPANDQQLRHEQLRAMFASALSAVCDEQKNTWIREAVEEAWELQLNGYDSTHLTLDVRKFSREATLRFCSRFFGLPRGQILTGQFDCRATQASEQLYWTLNAGHSVAGSTTFTGNHTDEKVPVIQILASIAAKALQEADTVKPRSFTDYLIINNHSLANTDGSLPMSNTDLASIIVGGFQAFMDNAVISACTILNELLKKNHDGEVANTYHQLQQLSCQAKDSGGRESQQVVLEIISSSRSAAAQFQEPQRYANTREQRIAQGFHLCEGQQLGDTLVANILMRIACLNNVTLHKNLQIRRGWIVSEFEICGETTAEKLSAQLLDVPLHTKGSLAPDRIDKLGTSRLAVLTDRQLKTLNPLCIPALRNNIAVLSGDQLIMLSDSALTMLSEAQAKQLSDDQLIALLNHRSNALQPSIRKILISRCSQIRICEIVSDVSRRPFAQPLCPSSSVLSSRPGLVNKSWTVRHIQAACESDMQRLPDLGHFESAENPGQITALFRRPQERKAVLADGTNVLFSWFAQWISNSFLLSNLNDRRRNQSNHEMALCQIYGPDERTTRLLRSNKGGKLRTGLCDMPGEYLPRLFSDNGELNSHFKALPYVANNGIHKMVARLNLCEEKRRSLFATGLGVGNSSFGYTAISTLFLREHNRICEELSCGPGKWNDEQLFQTARRVMTALVMKLIVEEYINHIAGFRNQNDRLYKLDHRFAENEPWYRSNRTTLEFNLLCRWHSLIPGIYNTEAGPISVSQARMNNIPLIKQGLGSILISATSQSACKPSLFNTAPELLDAEHAALRMSRDCKLASYETYRAHFGLGRLGGFNNLSENEDVLKVLEQLYGQTDNVELLIGLYAEEPQAGQLFGSLMIKMLAVDAFTQIFTNPLLSKNVFCARTFSAKGLQIIEETQSLSDVWDRNRQGEASNKQLGFNTHGL